MERINFSSLNAIRGSGVPKPKEPVARVGKLITELTPEERELWRQRAAAEMAAAEAKYAPKKPRPAQPAPDPNGERLNFQSLNAPPKVRSSGLPIGEAAPDSAPRYTPEEASQYANPMAAAQQKWLANKQDPAYSQTAKIIQHYYDNAMAGPTAMGRIAHGELDPLNREGIGAGLSAAWSLPMQTPFVPRGSVGVGGGQMGGIPRYIPGPDKL